MLQACLNGNRTKHAHPAVPCSPAELAQDAQAAVEAGAQELHVHPRDAEGMESLDPQDVAAVLRAIRARVPGVPVGISTHVGIPTRGRHAAALLRTWTVRPDYVSVNFHEDAAPTLLGAASECGIGVEAGICSVAAAARFVRHPQAAYCLRALIELEEQEVEAGLAVMQGILQVLKEARCQMPLLLHGCEATMWPLFQKAQAMGLSTRIGLEDGLLLPDGQQASGNKQLLQAATWVAD